MIEDTSRAVERSLSEPAAFHELFLAHHEEIRRYLHGRLAEPMVAEDLAAETFARAFAARHRFVERGHGVRPWLFEIATNLLRDELRRRHSPRRGALPWSGDVAAPALPTDPALAAELQRLPHSQLEVLLLHAWGELTYEEIAVALDLRVGTVRSRLHRARRHLQRALRPVVDTLPLTPKPNGEAP